MGSHGPRARSLLDWLFIGASAETGALAARVALAPRHRAFAISALSTFATAAANHTGPPVSDAARANSRTPSV